MAVREARVEAQAKINLFLRVLEREESGYHQIETLFCRIALADIVTVRVTDSGKTLECTGERVPAGGFGAPEHNLAWRAAAAYAEATGFPAGFAISVEKRIPVGAGLGGGSADAGAVLRALFIRRAAPDRHHRGLQAWHARPFITCRTGHRQARAPFGQTYNNRPP